MLKTLIQIIDIIKSKLIAFFALCWERDFITPIIILGLPYTINILKSFFKDVWFFAKQKKRLNFSLFFCFILVVIIIAFTQNYYYILHSKNIEDLKLFDLDAFCQSLEIISQEINKIIIASENCVNLKENALKLIDKYITPREQLFLRISYLYIFDNTEWYNLLISGNKTFLWYKKELKHYYNMIYIITASIMEVYYSMNIKLSTEAIEAFFIKVDERSLTAKDLTKDNIKNIISFKVEKDDIAECIEKFIKKKFSKVRINPAMDSSKNPCSFSYWERWPSFKPLK